MGTRSELDSIHPHRTPFETTLSRSSVGLRVARENPRVSVAQVLAVGGRAVGEGGDTVPTTKCLDPSLHRTLGHIPDYARNEVIQSRF